MNEQIMNIKFVQEVEKYPCLYNYKLKDYSRKDVIERAWNAVGKVFNLTESQSKEKWKNLRCVFVRHMKPGSSKNKKPYYLADAMQFTVPFVKVLNNRASLNHPQEAMKEVVDQEDNEETNEFPQTNEFPFPQPTSPNPYNIQNVSYILPTSSPISNQPTSPISCPSPKPTASNEFQYNFRKRKLCSTVDESIIDYLQVKKSKLQQNTEDLNDPKRMFLLSLMPDLKPMSESQMRTFKRKVLALVDEILEDPS